MVYEIVDNSVDEALVGYADSIEVVLEADGSVSVRDNGRGIPVGKNKKFKKSALEIILTVLHSGGKFGGGGYDRSGGLHGVGLSVVNALSSWVEVTVDREGKEWFLRMENMKAVKPVASIGDSARTGTKVRFMPDVTIFETVDFDYDILATRFKETAFLLKGISITLTDKRRPKEKTETFCYEDGVAGFVKEFNKSKKVLHKDVIHFAVEKDNTYVEAALQYTEDYTDNTFSYVNNIRTTDGGSHEQGFKTALTRAVNDVARKRNILKDKDKNLNGDDVREGLSCILSIRMSEPQFEGQTKGKLSSSEVKGIVEGIVGEQLQALFQEKPSILTAIVKKAQNAAKIREALKKTREVSKNKSVFDIAGMSSKFAGCTSRDPKETELYLVEGDSAGGSAKQGRERYFQAILPLRGKVINSEKAKLSDVLGNEEIKTIITAIGAGIGKDFDATTAKFQKVIIMTDADIDGEHIRTLLLTFFYRFMRELIEEGFVYIARPPLYKISSGKESHYAFSDKEKDEIIRSMKSKKVEIQRYKGLGEMNADQLWETTMNPQTRSLIRVNVADGMYANEIFETLMGSKVDKRREFIEDHAREANLDLSNS